MRDHIEFFKQFRERFETTGAISPSSRFLAAAMSRPLSQAKKPIRVLEVGPGTGAVTRKIVTLLGPEDRFDLVELNESFANLLKKRFEEHPDYRRVAAQSEVHVCPIEEFPLTAPYDFIISGLPLNNFPCDLVRRIFDVFFRLLAPGGTLSYFEYMYVRSVKRRISNGAERERLNELDGILNENIARHRIRRDWVFANFPPAWVQHLRAPE
ncbi:MAG: class I SAM-dependent methyltransferase [Planctomycetaceae bacterium]